MSETKPDPLPPSRYFMTTPVHPEKVVDWFLGLHHYWFDESMGPNAFTGMGDLARDYLNVWVETGELPHDKTMLEISLSNKFSEWLQSSWTTDLATVRAPLDESVQIALLNAIESAAWNWCAETREPGAHLDQAVKNLTAVMWAYVEPAIARTTATVRAPDAPKDDGVLYAPSAAARALYEELGEADRKLAIIESSPRRCAICNEQLPDSLVCQNCGYANKEAMKREAVPGADEPYYRVCVDCGYGGFVLGDHRCPPDGAPGGGK